MYRSATRRPPSTARGRQARKKPLRYPPISRNYRPTLLQTLEPRLLLSSSPTTVATPIISEFMADNESTITDQDGNFSDWIELHNPTPYTINLNGYFLTDNRSNSTKWRIPAVVLPPGAYRLIFASGKNRTNPAGELHTNFKLSNDGEYLALVKPDGFSIAHNFFPIYPPQFNDTSYGVPVQTTDIQLTQSNHPATLLVPTDNSLNTTWTGDLSNEPFDDSTEAGWTPVQLPIGYDTGLAASQLITPPEHLQAYYPLDETSGQSITDYSIHQNHGQSNIPLTSIQDPLRGPVLSFDGSSYIDIPTPVTDFGSSDFTISLWLKTTQTRVAVLSKSNNDATPDPAEKQLYIDVLGQPDFTSNHNGTIHGSPIINDNHWRHIAITHHHESDTQEVYIDGVLAVDSSSFTPDPDPENTTLRIGFDTSTEAVSNFVGQLDDIAIWNTPLPPEDITALAEGVPPSQSPQSQDTINTDIQHLAHDVNASIYTRIPFNIPDPSIIQRLSLNIAYDDGYIAYLNGIPVVFENTPIQTSFDSASRESRNTSDIFTPQSIDISAYIPFLQTGTNFLAFHLLNASSDDPDLLLAPQLLAQGPEFVDLLDEQYFANPTPSQINIPGEGLPADPAEFSIDSRQFTTPFTLTLTPPAPNATIRYTTDGSIPTDSSPLYISPIGINQTTQIRTRVYQPGHSPSPILSNTYTRIDSDSLQFSSNLPIVILDNYAGGDVPTNAFQSTFLSIIEPDSATSRATLDATAQIASRAGLKIRGSSTVNQPKHSFALEAWNETDDDTDITPLDLPPESDWILYAPYSFDRAMIRNTLIYDLSNQIGRYAVKTKFVEVFVNTDGGPVSTADYQGVYVLMEKIKRDPNRVAIQELQPNHNELPQVSGGYIFKIDRLDPGDLGFNAANELFSYVEPKEEDITNQQADYLTDYLDDFNNTLQSSLFTHPTLGYERYIDTNSFIDHHLINELAKNPDALKFSTFLFKDRNRKLNMGPVWDFDRAMGPHDDPRASDPIGWSPNFYYGWWERLFHDPDFKQAYIDRWQYLRKDTLSTQNILNTIDLQADQITEAQERNFQRWTDIPPDFGSWQGEIDHLKNWITQRLQWIDLQFLPQPTLSSPDANLLPGFSVEIDAPLAGDIYYTTNNTDPRLPNGAINPSAIAYNGGTTTLALIPRNDQWRYLDDGSNQSTAWKEPDFDDALWETGSAEFGYGDGDENTSISFGPNAGAKHITTYFRNTFTVDNPAEFDSLSLRILRDDGFVLYLNGQKLIADNMPAVGLNYRTRALTNIEGGGESTFIAFPIQPHLLLNGENTIAVEVHQSTPTSNDLSFNLELLAHKNTIAPPINFDESTAIQARAYDGHNWSSLARQTYQLADLASVKISEINYKPIEPTPQELLTDPTLTATDFEFIELFNPTPSFLDITNLTFTHGITFNFTDLPTSSILAPEERIVIVNNLSAFQLRHDTTNLRIVGQFQGDLNDSGEQLTLAASPDIPLFSVNYNQSTNWPTRAKGNGSSIQLINHFLQEDDPDSWQASSEFHGSPGQPDAGPRTDIIITEVLPNAIEPQSNAIEIYNNTDDPINLSHYFLSNSVDNYTQFQIPPDTIIQPGQYIAFDESLLIPGPPGASENLILDGIHGDTLYLLQADTLNNLISFVDQLSFGPAAPNESFGRWPTPQNPLYPQLAPSLAQPNSGPRVGPIIISELNYNPTPPSPVELVLDPTIQTRDFQYIEIHNPTDASIDLLNWRIEGGIDFHFTNQTILDPGQTIVLTSFDPSHSENEAKKLTFLNRYQLNNADNIHGPFNGLLNTGPQHLELQRPLTPTNETPPFTPYIIEDQLIYSATAPWPTTPNGQGDALHRDAPNLFANNPQNWTPHNPTPTQTSFITTAAVDTHLIFRSSPSESPLSSTLPQHDAPADTFFQRESAPFFAEIWVKSNSFPAGIQRGSVNLTFNPTDLNVPAVDHAEIFNQPGTTFSIIDLVNGSITFGGSTQLQNLGDNEYILLGRVLLSGQNNIDPVEQSFGPNPFAIQLNPGPINFTLNRVAPIVPPILHQPEPAEIRALIYDFDNNNIVNFADLSYALAALNQTPGGSEPPYATWADFNQNGAVDQDDIDLILSAFAKPFNDPTIIIPDTALTESNLSSTQSSDEAIDLLQQSSPI